jgi:SAM-dependent methyltransferase
VKTLESAYDEVKQEFPFKDYVGISVYYEMAAIINAIHECIDTRMGMSLLDIGCGPMDKTAIFQKLGFDCHAVDDLSDPWHDLANNRAKIIDFGKRMGINFHKTNAPEYSIPFAPAQFDIVTALAVIEHLHDSPRHFLNTMARYLKPRGLAVIAMPNAVNLRKRLSVMMGRTNYNPLEELYYSINGYRGHVREYTLGETKKLCKLNGLQVRYANHFEHLAQAKLASPLRQMFLLASSLFPSLRTGIIVVAEKPEGWEEKEVNADDYFSAIRTAVPPGVI